MKTAWGWSLALSMLLLQACATREVAVAPVVPVVVIPGNPPSCDEVPSPISDTCVIHIKVANEGRDSCKIDMVNKSGAILEDLDLVSLDANRARGKFFYWRIITSPGYEFTDDGIAFVDNNRPRMYTQGRKLNATEYQWKRNQRKDRRVNGYVISVIKPDPHDERDCERDPWIRTN